MRWFKRNLIGYFFPVSGALEALAGEVAVGSLVSLHRDQAGWQRAFEQLPIEPIKGSSQAGIGSGGRALHIHILLLGAVNR